MQQQQDDVPSLILQIKMIERDVTQLKTQLSLYVPVRENDLQLRLINDTTVRMENELRQVKERLETMNAHMASAEADAQKREADMRENQSKVQIRALIALLSIGGTIITGVIINYIVHLLH